MKQFWLVVLWACCGAIVAGAQPSSKNEIEEACALRAALAQQSFLKHYPARELGPSAPGGRIVDIDVNLRNKHEFYIGLASGGVFKTTNNGVTFFSIFDNVGALGIGDLALSQQNPDVLYVGTGEKNSSRSSYSGTGVYKTHNGGKTWEHLGLTGTHHISRIIIHPENPDVVWVAALGALYSHNEDRGVYKTTDGGKTWKKTLYLNDSTGVIDLVINPENPLQLLAASWERTRKAWHFKASGPGSAIYRSADGGETWTKSSQGFPQGAHVGRIGLQHCKTRPNVVYALLDNQQEVPDLKKEEKVKSHHAVVQRLLNMSKEEFLTLSDEALQSLFTDRLPAKYTPAVVRQEILEDKYVPKSLGEYLHTVSPGTTKIIGAEVYRSEDSGASWRKVNRYDLDGVFHTYGYYFGEVDVSPVNPDIAYVLGIPLLKTVDGGKTWHRIDTLCGTREVHVDHHAFWIDPDDPSHILLGNDGGLYHSYDEGASWLHSNNIPAAQFYTVNADMETPYNVYGGMQDNGVWKGSSEGTYWKPLFSGDGMFTAPDPRNSMTVYTGYHFGNYFRVELDKRKSVKISPQHGINEEPLRWNWRAPLRLSIHNPDVVYVGANKLFRSPDKGNSWVAISPDLTKKKRSGNVTISTLTAFAESPLHAGVLYAGTDDGNAWVTRDAGKHWEAITTGLPENRWISSIAASPHDEAVVYLAMNGSRENEYKTYLFKSRDYGKSWQSINGNLPEAPANIIIPDPVNPDLLYCGLDNGTYASLDGGRTWHLFNKLLNVPSYDMMVHPRENELIVGTHGRGIFIVDVKPLQAVRQGGLKTPVLGFAPRSVNFSEHWGRKKYEWEKINKPTVALLVFTSKALPELSVEVYDEKGTRLRTLKTATVPGFNTIHWDLLIEEPRFLTSKKKNITPPPDSFRYAGKGHYEIKFSYGRYSHTVDFDIK